MSNYRIPNSHCIVKEGVNVRLDQPRFTVQETDDEITVALHEKYIALLPIPIFPNEGDEIKVSDSNIMDIDEININEEDIGLDDLFDSDLEEQSQEEMFSQEFSQVSLDDNIQSPVNKKLKLLPSPIEVEKNEKIDNKNKCPYCKVFIGGGKAKINRHI